MNNTYLIVGIGIVIVALLILYSQSKSKEPYEVAIADTTLLEPRLPTALTTDPEKTGVELPMWGPLYPVQQYNNRYTTMSGMPENYPPLSTEIAHSFELPTH